jgi:large subunit ribosomal protein L9
MNVILLENITSLGNLGDSVTVKAGFARNYLLPKGKAVRATKENIEYFAAKKEELAKVAQEKLQQAKERAASIESTQLQIQALSAEDQKLYGSVGVNEIVQAAKSQNIELSKQEVQLPNGPIRELGTHKVALHLLHSDIVAELSVEIVEEQQ